jgi:hypothetical protein
MDFTRDPEEFPVLLATVKRDWGYASEKLFDLVEHWQELSKQYFGSLVDVSLDADAKSIEGKVLDKSFSLQLSHVTLDNAGYAEAVLLTNQLGGGKLELDRFRVDRNGVIWGVNAEKLLDSNDRFYSYKIITSILRAVM